MAIFLQGLVLMVSGMGIVFVFLLLLVGVMRSAARLVVKFNHLLPDEEPRRRPKAKVERSASGERHLELAIALAAVKAHSY